MKDKPNLKETAKKLLVLPPVAIGLLILGLSARNPRDPARTERNETARLVRVIEVPMVDLIPRCIGYGMAKPTVVWEAVAEVKGEIVELNPVVEKGAILPAGTLLLRIDPTSYEFAIAENEANISNIEAQQNEIEVREENYKASLEIDRQSLELLASELARLEKLHGSGSISQSDLESQKRQVLNHRAVVQTVENALRLIPVERKALAANLDLHRARLDEAKRHLEQTTIRAPIDGRVAAINVELTQFAMTGQVLVVLDSIDAIEIEARVPVQRIYPLISGKNRLSLFAELNSNKIFASFGIEAVVRYQAGDTVAQWQATFKRFSETVDPQTRTIAAIVEVPNPYAQAAFGTSPPLTKGMFCEVEMRGAPRPDRLIIPRSAVHGDLVYVVDADHRLRMRRVEIEFSQAGFVSISEGLAAGENVVITDLIPAIEGMLLKTRIDTERTERLIAEATAASDFK